MWTGVARDKPCQVNCSRVVVGYVSATVRVQVLRTRVFSGSALLRVAYLATWRGSGSHSLSDQMWRCRTRFHKIPIYEYIRVAACPNVRRLQRLEGRPEILGGLRDNLHKRSECRFQAEVLGVCDTHRHVTVFELNDEYRNRGEATYTNDKTRTCRRRRTKILPASLPRDCDGLFIKANPLLDIQSASCLLLKSLYENDLWRY